VSIGVTVMNRMNGDVDVVEGKKNQKMADGKLYFEHLEPDSGLLILWIRKQDDEGGPLVVVVVVVVVDDAVYVFVFSNYYYYYCYYYYYLHPEKQVGWERTTE